jgi:uncharacterized lipoprotein YehR (DUF1307 family)
MFTPSRLIRSSIALFTLSIIMLALAGCGGSSSSNKLDGVYHGGATTITLKDGKATVQIGGESQMLDYKVEGKTLRIVNPKEGDATFTINDDGTLSGQLGTLAKNPA